MFIDKKFRSARNWSNAELMKFAPNLIGDVINVSAYKDDDKEGSKYKNYFIKADTYNITNYDSEKKGITGLQNEIYLDLESDLPARLTEKFDVVFNHTTLEHVYGIHKAFENLCKMSRDYLIVVVPFLQEQHAFYGDYWRVTPLTLLRMCNENGFSPIYLSANDKKQESVYIFIVARRGEIQLFPHPDNILNDVLTNQNFFIGKNAITNGMIFNILSKLKNTIKSLL